ncbi:hypothetical protein IAE33_004695 [Pseudomonas sp. S60]|nr:hypothetical protein [Pseudomonas sp. S60]
MLDGWGCQIVQEHWIGRVAWFDQGKQFGCILCINGHSALVRGADLLDPGLKPAEGQLYKFRLVCRKNTWWAKEAAPVVPLPDELTTGTPPDGML